MRNPYAEEQTTPIATMMDLFGTYRVVPTQKRQSERGELLRYFSQKLGQPIPRLAFRLQGLEMQDLYYMKSAADSYEREGKGAWGKAFNGMLKSDHGR